MQEGPQTGGGWAVKAGDCGVLWAVLGHAPQHIAVPVPLQAKGRALRANGMNLCTPEIGQQSSQISVDNFVDMLSAPAPNPHGTRL